MWRFFRKLIILSRITTGDEEDVHMISEFASFLPDIKRKQSSVKVFAQEFTEMFASTQIKTPRNRRCFRTKTLPLMHTTDSRTDK